MAVRNLASHIATHITPQSEPIPGENQIKNSAGGYVYQITPWQQLQRWTVLGSSGGSYYVNERKMTQDNAAIVRECLKLDPTMAIQTIVAISDAGRAPSNDPAIMALAMASCDTNNETRKLAYTALPAVCRIPTHLFHFMEFRKAITGGKNTTSRGLRDAIAKWYLQFEPEKLAYETLKYQQRDGWSNRDLLRISHAKPVNTAQKDIFEWIKKDEVIGADGDHMLQIHASRVLHAEAVKPKQAAANISAFKLTHEMVPSQLFKFPEVWEALLENMPLTAMIRNLGTMTNVGLLENMARSTHKVVKNLNDQEYLKRSRIHPMQILTAMKVYQMGHGVKGSQTWTPVRAIVDALDEAFYLSFGNVIPTGKRLMLALDVSGSMGMGFIGNTFITCREAAAAMALITAKTEQNYELVGFTSSRSGGVFQRDNGLTVLNISPRQRLDDVVKYTASLPFGGTDISLPFLYAAQNKTEYDAFVVLTDNETWQNPHVHPIQALRMYREKSGISAKLVVVGMTSTGFSVCDPNDALCLDCVGFDTSTPSIISDFIRE